jgi:copper(I)-binding protein
MKGDDAMPIPTRRLLLAAPALLLARPALAHHDTVLGDITIAHPWTRAAAAGANGAAYMTLRNAGREADQLVAGSTPVARTVELHTHIRDGEVMRMRQVRDIALPAGQAVRLRPGGLHVMLIGLAEPLRAGAEMPLTLRFARAGEVTVQLEIQAAGSRGHTH